VLTTPLQHAEILSALAGAGHGSLVLVADGNYPTSTTRGPNAAVVHLNLVPGIVDAVTIFDALVGAVPVEQVHVMQPTPDGAYAVDDTPSIWAEFERVLAEHGNPLQVEPVERHAFYALVGTPQVALVVVSADTRWYANVMLRIGALPG
jgi:L-fucose mutarotase